MKIVIAGAGALGFHLAKLLSGENQDITLIDIDEKVIAHVTGHLDVMTIRGDATSIDILEQARVETAQLFIAVTTSEKTNLLLAILAKQYGAKKTIARVDNPEYLEQKQKVKFGELGVDVLISPELLAAQEVERLLSRASFTDLYEFENSQMSVVGITLDSNCRFVNHTMAEIEEPEGEFKFRGIALLRGHKTILPKGNTRLRKGDHLYIVTRNEFLDTARSFVGKEPKPIKHVMIIGGTSLALRTAQLIEDKYKVTVVLNNKERGKEFLESLDRTMVIEAEEGNIEALKEEGMDKMDAFVALTPNSETNIITSLMAQDLGVYKTIALVDNINYTHISQNIGIDTIINKKLIAANNIFRFVRKGKVEAIVGLHGVEAEMILFEIHKKNRLLRHPIKDLHLPEKSIIAGIIRGEESYIPDGDSQFEINDKVIVLAFPEAIGQVEKIFK